MIKDVVEKKSPDIVLDLSDEPVVDYKKRFEIASSIFKKNVLYFGSDFSFSPPKRLDVLEKPSTSIVGTGKRTGKTSVGITVGKLLKREGFAPIVICMGRGGPPEPHLVDVNKFELDVETLSDISEEGKHAASDYLEEALLSGVPAIGCRRCGVGDGGKPRRF